MQTVKMFSNRKYAFRGFFFGQFCINLIGDEKFFHAFRQRRCDMGILGSKKDPDDINSLRYSLV